MLSLAELAAGFIVALMKIPYLRELFFQLAVEVLTRDDRDPEYKAEYLALTAQLRKAKTPEEKRPILARIDQLKRGGSGA